MIYAAGRDGRVLRIDLEDPAGARAWEELASGPDPLTSLAVGWNGTRADLPIPRRFRGEILLSAELIRDRAGAVVAERVSAHVDKILFSLTLYRKESRVRADLERVGRKRY